MSTFGMCLCVCKRSSKERTWILCCLVLVLDVARKKKNCYDLELEDTRNKRHNQNYNSVIKEHSSSLDHINIYDDKYSGNQFSFGLPEIPLASKKDAVAAVPSFSWISPFASATWLRIKCHFVINVSYEERFPMLFRFRLSPLVLKVHEEIQFLRLVRSRA